MAHILDLPEEITLIIFGHLMEQSDQFEFLSRISQVCKRWKALCHSSRLWDKIDGSITSDTLLSLSKNGCLQNTKELVYSKMSILKSSKKLDTIFAGMPNLKTIDFRLVQKFSSDVFTCLQRHCKDVCELKIYNHYFRSDEAFFGEFLMVQGHKLTRIELSALSICSSLLTAITTVCHNLENLKLGGRNPYGYPTIQFPLKEAQECCIKLKELHFISPVIFPIDETNSNKLLGFPLLEVFSYHITVDYYEREFKDKDLKNILSQSPLLKVLDIRKHESITANAIVSLPATQLKSLYISKTKLLDSQASATMVLTKWEKSLCNLMISSTKSECLNEVLQNITYNGEMRSLSYLDLSDTNVTKETVFQIIANCPRLNVLKLSYCNNIGFHDRQEFRSRYKVLKLQRFLVK